MFLTCCSPRSSKAKATLSRTWSRTTRLTQIPPGSASPSSRAATFTPSPKMSCASTITSPRLMPMRNLNRCSSGTSGSRSAMPAILTCFATMVSKKEGTPHLLGLKSARSTISRLKGSYFARILILDTAILTCFATMVSKSKRSLSGESTSPEIYGCASHRFSDRKLCISDVPPATANRRFAGN